MNDYFVKRSLFIFLWFFLIAGLLHLETPWLSETVTIIIRPLAKVKTASI